MRKTKLTTNDTIRRLDLWLWFARFFKSRTLATRFVQTGRLRVNAKIVKKAHHNIRIGDILTFPKLDRIIVVEVLTLGVRRGPVSEARRLYDDISTPTISNSQLDKGPKTAAGVRPPGSGRPTKRQRRALDRLRAD